jgi:hypothetical protein
LLQAHVSLQHFAPAWAMHVALQTDFLASVVPLSATGVPASGLSTQTLALPQVLPDGQFPHCNASLHLSEIGPQVFPSAMQVVGVQVPAPQTFATPPPPQTSVPIQPAPHWSTLPQLSGIEPQFFPSPTQVLGVQTVESSLLFPLSPQLAAMQRIAATPNRPSRGISHLPLFLRCQLRASPAGAAALEIIRASSAPLQTARRHSVQMEKIIVEAGRLFHAGSCFRGFRRRAAHASVRAMRTRQLCFVVLFFSCLSLSSAARAEPSSPRVVVGVNAAQMAWNIVAGTAIGVTWIPVPIEASVRLTDRWGLTFGLHYRYEDYWEGSGLWNDYHEVFIMGGPRVSISNRGLRGWFASAQIGIGYAHDPSPYTCVSIVLQPELGYSWVFGRPGLHLAIGAGLLVNIAAHESPGLELTAIGWIAHRFIPLFDLKLGFGI